MSLVIVEPRGENEDNRPFRPQLLPREAEWEWSTATCLPESSQGGALIDAEQITRRLTEARSAILGTVDSDGRPHLVPIVFAYREGRIYTAVDRKPKSTNRLKRLRNIEANPGVSVLVDRYDDDWTRLWWIRIDGLARVVDSGPAFSEGFALLTRKYQPYDAQPPPGPVIEVRVETIRAWSAT